MQGADRVNDEFEVGYNLEFEERWYKAEIIGRVVMIAFVGVALSGLLGRGPFSHETAKSPDGAISVDYEPVARNGTPTTVTLHIGNPEPMPRHVTVSINTKLIEPLGYQRTIPLAQSSTVNGDGVSMDFLIDPNQPDSMIRLSLQPSQIGPVELHAGIGGTSNVDWSMVVLP